MGDSRFLVGKFGEICFAGRAVGGGGNGGLGRGKDGCFEVDFVDSKSGRFLGAGLGRFLRCFGGQSDCGIVVVAAMCNTLHTVTCIAAFVPCWVKVSLAYD